MMKALPLLMLLCCGAGCAPSAPRLDARFGASVRGLMAQQALPPQPHQDAGMDAAAARGALARYRQSFQNPAPVPSAPAWMNPGGGGNAR